MKKTIRLTESDLHKLIGESVKRILSEGNAWADQQPVDKNHPDWWYYRQEIEPDEVEDFDDEPVGESKLRNIVRESIKRVMNETELNYDVDNFSGRYYKNPPEEIDPTDYLDDPNNPPGSGEDWTDWADFVEDEFGGDQKAAENAYSWGLHDNSGFFPDGDKGRMAYGYDTDSMIDRNNDSIDDEERVKTAMGKHEKKKWLNGAKDDEMFDFLHPGVYGESKLRSIVRESIKRVVNESYLYTKDINTDDLRINGHWTEDGYAEWEASVDNGWYTLRGTYDGHDCELEEIIEGHSGHGHQHEIDDDAIDWFNQNICDRVKSWLDKYAKDYSEWNSNMYGEE